MDRHVQATGKWTGMSSKRWKPSNGQAHPACIGNQIMARHVQQALATGKWTGMSRRLANGQACPGYWQMDRHVQALANGQACPGNWQMDRHVHRTLVVTRMADR